MTLVGSTGVPVVISRATPSHDLVDGATETGMLGPAISLPPLRRRAGRRRGFLRRLGDEPAVRGHRRQGPPGRGDTNVVDGAGLRGQRRPGGQVPVVGVDAFLVADVFRPHTAPSLGLAGASREKRDKKKGRGQARKISHTVTVISASYRPNTSSPTAIRPIFTSICSPTFTSWEDIPE